MNLRKFTGNIVTGLFIFLFLVAAIIILAPYVGWHLDSVLSGSMEPAIHTGDLAILGPVATNDIQVGDIIAYYKGNVEICHRVTAVEGGDQVAFITKGDANRSPDGTPVTPEKVNGKLVFSIPLAGHFIYFMKTPLGLFLTILLPLLFLIGSELKAVLFSKEEENASRDPE
jgi:signal peptidase I